MKKRQIINIVNFVRGCEPRLPELDIVEPVKEQINLLKKHGLKGTFLLQYDALIAPVYQELFRALPAEQFEIGVWHEIVQPEVEACGIKWRGRYTWDWHTDCGFSVGYTKKERELIIDELYGKFKEIFGYYPRSFGSWFFDTHTARYVSERYGADAFCNCKEQYGTDGYTLWGGYYGQGYYPSRSNVFVPASCEQTQIPVPLFRMLGSDPVYQYDYLIDEKSEAPVAQGVITLEPAKPAFGGVREWVEWFMKESFNGDCLTFGYAQAGQENSFGWEKMKDGLIYQHELFERLQREGKIEVEQLGETGRWFKSEYSKTPASAITAHTAYDDEDKSSVWYSTSRYRINLYSDGESVRIRDIHIFSDALGDAYDESPCTTTYAAYEALPFIDGCRYTGCGVRAGGYLKYADGSEVRGGRIEFHDEGGGHARVRYGDTVFDLFDDRVRISAPAPFTLENRMGIDGNHVFLCVGVSDGEISLSYNGTPYSVKIGAGRAVNCRTVISDGNTMELCF